MHQVPSSIYIFDVSRMCITSPCTDIDGSGESDGSAELIPYPPWTSSTLLAPSAQPSPSVLLDGRHQTWNHNNRLSVCSNDRLAFDTN